MIRPRARTSNRAHPRRTARGVLALAGCLALGACSLVGEDEGGATGREDSAGDTVVLLTHDSFSLPDELVQQFEQDSGYTLEQRPLGDAGELTNQLVLTADEPAGDVAYGVDNTFASRALDAGVFAPYDVEQPAGVSDYDVEGDDDDTMLPVDEGNVCVNVDDTWFAAQGLQPPTTLDDLTDPRYRDLLVLPGAATSSTGLAFLLATVARYGDDWPTYWSDLVGNGAKITAGWEGAYQNGFTQGGGNGQRPIVVSYDSSPAFTLADDGTSTTSALLDTCFQQVEYAGELAGAANPDGARALLQWLVSPAVQAALPESMYVFPVREGVDLPPDWAEHATQPTDPFTVPPADIAAHREDWLREWTDVTSR